MSIVFEKPKALTDAPLHYCPGCTHGIIHRLVAEAIDALGIEGRTIGIASVGCSVMAYDYFTSRLPTAERLPSQPASSGPARRISSLPTRATATWPPSARRRRSMPRRAGKISP